MDDLLTYSTTIEYSMFGWFTFLFQHKQSTLERMPYGTLTCERVIIIILIGCLIQSFIGNQRTQSCSSLTSHEYYKRDDQLLPKKHLSYQGSHCDQEKEKQKFCSDRSDNVEGNEGFSTLHDKTASTRSRCVPAVPLKESCIPTGEPMPAPASNEEHLTPSRPGEPRNSAFSQQGYMTRSVQSGERLPTILPKEGQPINGFPEERSTVTIDPTEEQMAASDCFSEGEMVIGDLAEPVIATTVHSEDNQLPLTGDNSIGQQLTGSMHKQIVQNDLNGKEESIYADEDELQNTIIQLTTLRFKCDAIIDAFEQHSYFIFVIKQCSLERQDPKPDPDFVNTPEAGGAFRGWVTFVVGGVVGGVVAVVAVVITTHVKHITKTPKEQQINESPGFQQSPELLQSPGVQQSPEYRKGQTKQSEKERKIHNQMIADISKYLYPEFSPYWDKFITLMSSYLPYPELKGKDVTHVQHIFEKLIANGTISIGNYDKIVGDLKYIHVYIAEIVQKAEKDIHLIRNRKACGGKKKGHGTKACGGKERGHGTTACGGKEKGHGTKACGGKEKGHGTKACGGKEKGHGTKACGGKEKGHGTKACGRKEKGHGTTCKGNRRVCQEK